MRVEYYENSVLVRVEEIPDPPLEPLDILGVMATLNAVLGLWSVEDAANTVGLAPQDLINEAQAWAAAQNLSAD